MKMTLLLAPPFHQKEGRQRFAHESNFTTFSLAQQVFLEPVLLALVVLVLQQVSPPL
jgi:hypothetical protein